MDDSSDMPFKEQRDYSLPGRETFQMSAVGATIGYDWLLE